MLPPSDPRRGLDIRPSPGDSESSDIDIIACRMSEDCKFSDPPSSIHRPGRSNANRTSWMLATAPIFCQESRRRRRHHRRRQL